MVVPCWEVVRIETQLEEMKMEMMEMEMAFLVSLPQRLWVIWLVGSQGLGRSPKK